MTSAKSLWHQSASASEILLEYLPAPAPGQLVIQSLFSLISQGTEKTVALQRVPHALYSDMAVPYMAGTFDLPIKYGYSVVGQVITAGKHLDKYVHLLHPHQDFCVVNEADCFFFDVKKVPARRAVLASNLETAVNAIWDAQVMLGDRILITGFGMIGCLLAMVLQSKGFEKVVVYEKDLTRCKLAESMGITLYLPEQNTEPFDVAFNCSASEQALQLCIDQTGMESKIIELSWYGNQSQNLHLGARFHYQRKHILSSQVSNIPAHQKSRWDFQRRKVLVFDLLENNKFDQCLDHEIALEEAPEFFNLVREGKTKALGTVIKYS